MSTEAQTGEAGSPGWTEREAPPAFVRRRLRIASTKTEEEK
jgi:hypothetical protein